MNDYAALLDMRSTHYSNPTGIDSTSAKTTVLDTAKLAAKAAENQLYLKISTTPEYKINDTITVYNRNALVSQFSAQGYLNKNAKGLIAGSTDQGGFILAALAQRNERSFLCVVMGATADENEIYSYKTASDLFTYAFNGYTGKILGYAGDKVTSIEVKLALDVKSAPTVNCVIADDVYAVIPDNAETSDISFKYYLHEDTLTAPIEKNTVVGGIDFYYKGAKIAEGKLVTEKYVSENSLLVFLDNMKNAFISPFFLITVLLIATFTLTYLYLKRKTAFRGRINKHSRKIRI
jgi:D-alanyl-D-alanine carboxypeptidase (penicillin-binding protein 5/6)